MHMKENKIHLSNPVIPIDSEIRNSNAEIRNKSEIQMF